MFAYQQVATIVALIQLAMLEKGRIASTDCQDDQANRLIAYRQPPASRPPSADVSPRHRPHPIRYVSGRRVFSAALESAAPRRTT